MTNIFEELAGSFPKMAFLKVDIDENEEVSYEEGIEAMSSYYVYKNGRNVERIHGVNQRHDLMSLCTRYDPL
jgi:thioredoxin-like negative regulator of GroEL